MKNFKNKDMKNKTNEEEAKEYCDLMGFEYVEHDRFCPIQFNRSLTHP
jgi:hypothetical protein